MMVPVAVVIIVLRHTRHFGTGVPCLPSRLCRLWLYLPQGERRNAA